MIESLNRSKLEKNNSSKMHVFTVIYDLRARKFKNLRSLIKMARVFNSKNSYKYFESDWWMLNKTHSRNLTLTPTKVTWGCPHSSVKLILWPQTHPFSQTPRLKNKTKIKFLPIYVKGPTWGKIISEKNGSSPNLKEEYRRLVLSFDQSGFVIIMMTTYDS